ncbi:MAG: amidohydrolase [Deinococcales bacterium]
MSDTIRSKAQSLSAETVAIRRDFHENPEIAFEEVRTSSIIADYMQGLGMEVRRNVGKTGVVASWDSGASGKTLLLRADIDALPIHDEKQVAYRSKIDGAMHACGHDGHAAVLMSTAKILKEEVKAGKLIFIFQPAEEIVKGAEAMLADDALQGQKPDAVIGLHLSSNEATGNVAFKAGPAMAAADAFGIKISGKGGHAAMPQMVIDPIVISAQLITALQTLVARETDPVDQAVISITSIHGGTAYNIIPEAVELKGTLRTFKEKTRSHLMQRINDLTKGLAQSMRAEIHIEWLLGSPAVVNDALMTERFKQVAEKALGQDKVFERDPIMGGDDMSLWLRQGPGCYFFVGAGNKAKDSDYPHHHPRFDIDEAALPIAVELLSKGALEYLS